MADAGKKPFWRTKKGLLIIGALIIAAVLYSRANAPKFPPDADCGTPKIHILDKRVDIGKDVLWVVTGPDGGQYSLTLGVAKLERGTPSSMKVEKAEEDAGKKAAILGDNLVITGCRIAGQVPMALPYGEYTLRLWDTTGADPVQVAETTITSRG
ncbi:hypothetical protein AB0I28_28305 [Phytomonospora sp. NPDC050363]|uniref:hypothetical protein n=1 Tax=Phytomonospora sp. NPDC050363 TaxID=3155642 RepID=UPI0033E094B1